MRQIFIAMSAVILLAPLPAAAQDHLPESRFGEPPRSRLLLELARVMGESHLMTIACDGLNEQYWRDRMVELLSLEAENRYRLREDMIDAFNDGYRDRNRRNNRCDANMREDRANLSERGRLLAQQLGEPYL